MRSAPSADFAPSSRSQPSGRSTTLSSRFRYTFLSVLTSFTR